MAVHWKWVATVRRKFRKSKRGNTIIVVHINNSRSLSIGGSTTGGDEEEEVKGVEALEVIEEKGCEEIVERTEGGADQNVEANQNVAMAGNQNADGNGQNVEENQNADGKDQIVEEHQNADGNDLQVEESKNVDENGGSPLEKEVGLSEQQIAAIKIQSFFRGYLARRAFQALRSLVKMQAMVRGVRARKQSHIALNCMQALVRLQVRVRSRQLLSSVGDNSPLNDSIKEVQVQRHAVAPIPLSA